MKVMFKKVFLFLFVILFLFTSSINVFAVDPFAYLEKPEVDSTITFGNSINASVEVNFSGSVKSAVVTFRTKATYRYKDGIKAETVEKSVDVTVQNPYPDSTLNYKRITASLPAISKNKAAGNEITQIVRSEDIVVEMEIKNVDGGEPYGNVQKVSPTSIISPSNDAGGSGLTDGNNETGETLGAISIDPITVGKSFGASVYVYNPDKAYVTVRFKAYVGYRGTGTEELLDYYPIETTEKSGIVDTAFKAFDSKSGKKVDHVKVTAEIISVVGGIKANPYTSSFSTSNITEKNTTADPGTNSPGTSNPGTSTTKPADKTTINGNTAVVEKYYTAVDQFGWNTSTNKWDIYKQIIKDGPIAGSVRYNKDGYVGELGKDKSEVVSGSNKSLNPSKYPNTPGTTGETQDTVQYYIKVTYSGPIAKSGTQTNTNNNNNSTTTKTETIKTETFAEITAEVPRTVLKAGDVYNVKIKVKGVEKFPLKLAFEQLVYGNSGAKKSWEKGILTFDSNGEKTTALKVPYSADFKKIGLRITVDNDAESKTISDYTVSQKYNDWYKWDGTRWSLENTDNRFTKAQDYAYYNKGGYANILTKVANSETLKKTTKEPRGKGKYVGEMAYAVGTAEVKYEGTVNKIRFNNDSVEFSPVDIVLPTVTLSDAKIENNTIEYGKTYEASVKVDNPEGSVTKLIFTPIYVTYKNGKVAENRQGSVQAAVTGANKTVKVTLPEMKNKNTNEVKVEVQVNRHEYFNKYADARNIDMVLSPAAAVSNGSTVETTSSEVSLESVEISGTTVKLESGVNIRVELDNKDKRHIILKLMPELESDGQTATGDELYIVTNKNGKTSIRLNNFSTAGLSNNSNDTTVKVIAELVDSEDITVVSSLAATGEVEVKSSSQWTRLAESAVDSGEWKKVSTGVETTTQTVVINNPTPVQQTNNQQQNTQQQTQATAQTTSTPKISLSNLSIENVTDTSFKGKVFVNNYQGAKSAKIKFQAEVLVVDRYGNQRSVTLYDNKEESGARYIETRAMNFGDSYPGYKAKKITLHCEITEVVGGAKADDINSVILKPVEKTFNPTFGTVTTSPQAADVKPDNKVKSFTVYDMFEYNGTTWVYKSQDSTSILADFNEGGWNFVRKSVAVDRDTMKYLDKPSSPYKGQIVRGTEYKVNVTYEPTK